MARWDICELHVCVLYSALGGVLTEALDDPSTALTVYLASKRGRYKVVLVPVCMNPAWSRTSIFRVNPCEDRSIDSGGAPRC
ncbi:hypothetical protein B0H17DRAFT_1077530 [Mycena rosella]|uniref:Uncharacterized protein n=1 Tax=Mycena rosella TaxID=1033263 RepID=A0AAD7D6R9_MYCRO|nr:hypothetical protein B0H17DRAFT_1077530 [Mycena rosella]